MNPKRNQLICAAALALITLALYWPVTGFEFLNYDDTDYVTLNPNVQQGVTPAALEWAFTSAHASNWHPLTWISHMLDCRLFGLRPGWHHLVNLLFHTANVVLLIYLLGRMTGSVWRSAIVAALFAWHPLHVESVAWVSERKDVLSAFFWLLTMLAYTRYAAESQRQSPQRKGYYLLALLCFVLGLLSKPMVVTLPFALLLLDFWPLKRIYDFENRRRGDLTKLLLEKVPFLILAALTSAATVWAQRAGNSVVSAAALPWSDRVANALVSYVLYLGKTFWPANLAVLYPYTHEWTFFQAAAAAALLLFISALVISQWRARPYLAVGWFWFLGTLVPVIGLVQVGLQFMADRYTYLPLIGIFIMAAWSIPARWAAWPRPGFVFGTAGVAILLILILATSVQLSYWHDSIRLFTLAAAATDDSVLIEYNLAAALAQKGDEPDAITHYLKAVAIHPDRVEAQYNSQPQAHFNLGLIYRSHARWPEAEAQLRAAVAADPSQAMHHRALGSVLLSEGRFPEAAVELEQALAIQPANAGARYDLAVALENQGDAAGAEPQYREFLKSNPGSPEALTRLSWLLATQPRPELRNGPLAVQLAETARTLTRTNDPQALASLDAAYAESGRFPDAITAVRKTSQVAQAQQKTNTAAAAAARLILYQSGKPFRQ